MAESMKASTRRIKSMVMVSIPGLTAENMMVNGRTGANTALVNTFRKLASSEKESGRMAREKSGLMKIRTQTCEIIPDNF